MFILKAVLVIKRNVMITEQIRTLEYIQEFLVYKIVVNFFRNSVSKLMRTKKWNKTSSSSKITEIYTHVSKNAISRIKNPVDDFFE